MANSLSYVDAKKLLARIAAYDNRTVDVATVESWMDIVQGYTLDELLWAFREFAMVNTSEYLRPGHLTGIVNQKRYEYRMMNPARSLDQDAWLEFEALQEIAAQEARAIRAEGHRSAVEVMDSYDPKELES